MAREPKAKVRMRIVIEQPVIGVAHSLQDKEGHPLNPIRSNEGEPLVFDFMIQTSPGPKFFGDQVRREGPERRFVYIRIGQLAGDLASPWTRRMKIDIHDIPQHLLDSAAGSAGRVELSVNGTGRDGTPACATVSATKRLIA
jgi:hypothetical protein